MAGSLVKIDEEIVTSAVASVTLTGIDSTYDVYQLVISNFEQSSNQSIVMRVTESGTDNDTANYDYAFEYLKSATAFGTLSNTNQTSSFLTATVGSTTNYSGNVNAYLFNFNNASEYSFFTVESTHNETGGTVVGLQGGGVFTSSSSCDGVYIFGSSSYNFTGNFTLYGLKK